MRPSLRHRRPIEPARVDHGTWLNSSNCTGPTGPTCRSSDRSQGFEKKCWPFDCWISCEALSKFHPSRSHCCRQRLCVPVGRRQPTARVGQTSPALTLPWPQSRTGVHIRAQSLQARWIELGTHAWGNSQTWVSYALASRSDACSFGTSAPLVLGAPPQSLTARLYLNGSSPIPKFKSGHSAIGPIPAEKLVEKSV